jgi:hypothetical protein
MVGGILPWSEPSFFPGNTLCRDCKETYRPTQAQSDELLRECGTEEFNVNVNIAYRDE